MNLSGTFYERLIIAVQCKVFVNVVGCRRRVFWSQLCPRVGQGFSDISMLSCHIDNMSQ